jgi:hypothetical protein
MIIFDMSADPWTQSVGYTIRHHERRIISVDGNGGGTFLLAPVVPAVKATAAQSPCTSRPVNKFFHPIGDWLSYGEFEIILYFNDDEVDQDLFYFCHVSTHTFFKEGNFSVTIAATFSQDLRIASWWFCSIQQVRASPR